MRRAWAGVLLVLALALVFALRSADDAPTEAGGDPRIAERGSLAGTYRLSFASSSRVVAMVELGGGRLARDDAIETVFSLETVLTLRSIPNDSPLRHRFALSFASCETGRFELAGTQHFNGRDACEATLVGPVLLVDLTPAGVVETLHEPAGAPELFGYLAGYLVSAIQFDPRPRRESWTTEEPNLLGVALSHYRREGERLRRERHDYVSLDATARLRGAVETEVSGLHQFFFGSDQLQKLVGAETVRAQVEGTRVLESISRIELQRAGEANEFDGEIDPRAFSVRALREARDSPELRRKLLEQQADGLTATELVNVFREYAASGTLPNHNRLLWRAHGLLMLEPERVWELRPVFEGGNSTARRLVLDLLASVGHSEAQAMMRELLASEAAQGDPHFEELYQRVGFVDVPESETVAMVETRYRQARDEGDDDARFASAYTLGALAQRADEETAEPLREELTRDLFGATDPVETQHLLRALGNARHPENVATLVLFADHADPDVRTVVASSLGRPATERGRGWLMTLLDDPDRLVQKQAIRNLRHHALEGDDFDTLAALVTAGRIHQVNLRPLFELAKHFRSTQREGTEMLLQAMLDHGIDDNQVHAATRQLLQW